MVFDLGSIIPVLAGEWNSNTTYHMLYIVSYGGGSYISKVNNNTNHVVTDTNYWQKIAEPGGVGPAGAGSQGATGAQGAMGVQGPAGSGSGSGTPGAQGAQGAIGRQGNGWWYYPGTYPTGQVVPMSSLVGGNVVLYPNELIVDSEGYVYQILETDGRVVLRDGLLFRIVGRAGSDGAQGARGVTGPAGAQGAVGATGPAGMGVFVATETVSQPRADIFPKPNTLIDIVQKSTEITSMYLNWNPEDDYISNPGQIRFSTTQDVTLNVVYGGDASKIVWSAKVEGFENMVFKSGYTYLITIYGDMVDIKSFMTINV